MTTPSLDPELANHYDGYYVGGETEWRRLGAEGKAGNVIGLCADQAFGKVLEIGAGDGSVLEELSKAGFAREYGAAEISNSAVDVIRNRGISGLKDVTLFDGYVLPYAPNAFDLAILSHVVEHVEHPRMLLKEAARIADFIFVEVPLELKWRTPRDYRWTSTGHINIYSPTTIRHLLQSTGLEIVEEKVTTQSLDFYRFLYGKKAAPRYLLKKMMLAVVPALATRLFTYHWSALCKTNGSA